MPYVGESLLGGVAEMRTTGKRVDQRETRKMDLRSDINRAEKIRDNLQLGDQTKR